MTRTVRPATSADRDTIRRLEARLARASHRLEEAHAEIARLQEANARLSRNHKITVRMDDLSARRPHYQTLTDEELPHRHGDENGAHRLTLLTTEIAAHTRRKARTSD